MNEYLNPNVKLSLFNNNVSVDRGKDVIELLPITAADESASVAIYELFEKFRISEL